MLLVVILVLIAAAINFYKELKTEYVDLNNLAEHCRIDKSCGDLVGLNCLADIDGPYYYVNRKSGAIVGYCGGYCLGGAKGKCKNCPPKEWTCELY